VVNQQSKKSVVTLVGAGPGDPELLTLKAVRKLSEADVVVYDSLVNAKILKHTREDCQQIYVGKRKGCHSMKQERINDILVTLALQGLKVVRLKGGDPMIFGRATEELLALAEKGISAEIIPGVSAALGVAAYAKMPLTQRYSTSAVSFISAHKSGGKIEIDPNLVRSKECTYVFFMGLSCLEKIIAVFLEAGFPSKTPISIVAHATSPNQQQLVSTLNDMPDLVAQAQIPSPALIVVGACVNFAEQLNQMHQKFEALEVHSA